MILLEGVSRTKIKIDSEDDLLDHMGKNNGFFYWRPGSFEGYDSEKVYNMLNSLVDLGILTTVALVTGDTSYNNCFSFLFNDDATKRSLSI